MEALRGRWTIPVLCVLVTGSVRLGELRKLMPKASKKGLTSALKSLERTQLVIRHDLTDMVLHVEYELVTDVKARLISFLNELAGFPKADEG